MIEGAWGSLKLDHIGHTSHDCCYICNATQKVYHWTHQGAYSGFCSPRFDEYVPGVVLMTSQGQTPAHLLHTSVAGEANTNIRTVVMLRTHGFLSYRMAEHLDIFH